MKIVKENSLTNTQFLHLKKSLNDFSSCRDARTINRLAKLIPYGVRVFKNQKSKVSAYVEELFQVEWLGFVKDEMRVYNLPENKYLQGLLRRDSTVNGNKFKIEDGKLYVKSDGKKLLIFECTDENPCAYFLKLYRDNLETVVLNNDCPRTVRWILSIAISIDNVGDSIYIDKGRLSPVSINDILLTSKVEYV